MVKVRRREQLLVTGDWFVQTGSGFQYVNRSRADLQFDHLRTSTPTYQSGETRRHEQLGQRPRKQDKVSADEGPNLKVSDV